MDIGRFAGVLGSETHATHQRIAAYVRAVCNRYPGVGFTPREEWAASTATMVGHGPVSVRETALQATAWGRA